MQQAIRRHLPQKSRNLLPIWSEFNQLSLKYNSINLCHGSPVLQPPDFLIENLNRACREGFNQYTMFMGHPNFRNQLSEFFSPMFKSAKNNQVLNPNNEILVTTGACEGLFAALHHLVEHGDEVLTFEPYYTSYVNYVEYAGAKLKTVPFKVSGGKWEYDFDAFERAITPKTKVVMLINPHNPTGKIFTRSELEKLTLIIEKHPQLLVVSDDVYFFLPFDKRDYTLFANIGENYQRTLTVFSAGKMLNCTGWKVGWVIGPQDLIKNIGQVHEACTFNVNVPGQIAIGNSFQQTMKPYEGHSNYYEFVRDTFEKSRNNAIEMLKLSKDIKFKPTQCESGYFMAVNIAQNKNKIPDKYFKPGNYEEDKNTLVIQRQWEGRDQVPLDYAFCRWLAIEKGIALMPLSCFCLEESPYKLEKYVRLAICKTPEFFKDKDLLSRFAAL